VLVGRALLEASTRIRVITSSTPRNYRAEVDRLSTARDVEAPRFFYAPPPDLSALRLALEAIEREVAPHGALGEVYAARTRELAEEAAICEGAGSRALWAAARVRFARRDAFDDDADQLAEAWLGSLGGARSGTADVISDDPADPRSLLCRMRDVIGARRLPVRVLVARDIASLATTGDGFVQVAAKRMLSIDDVERTVHHEIEGHVVPRTRAGQELLSIFTLGTRRGSDDQEGRALWLEDRSGFLTRARRRELALRHTAARLVEGEASFVDIVRALEKLSATRAEAVRYCARAYRGGGLAREAVYLPAYLRIRAHLTETPELAKALDRGTVSVGAARALLPWIRAASSD
jgi:hypothetical protein